MVWIITYYHILYIHIIHTERKESIAKRTGRATITIRGVRIKPVCKICHKLLIMLINPLTGEGAKLRPEKVVCSKNHKNTPEQAMLFLKVPADREKFLYHMVFFSRSKSARCYAVRA